MFCQTSKPVIILWGKPVLWGKFDFNPMGNVSQKFLSGFLHILAI